MDSVIRDHLKNDNANDIFCKLLFKIKINPKRGVFGTYFIARNFLNNIKWINDKVSPHFNECIVSSEFITKLVISYNIQLTTEKCTLMWNIDGELQDEEYYNNDFTIIKRIKYVNKTKLISYKTIYFIYDFINGDVYVKFPELKTYKIEELEKIAKGNLSIVNLERGILFYIDVDGKVNAVTIDKYYKSLKKRAKYIRDNLDKLKEDAEGFRLDPRNYVPKYLDIILK